MLLSLERVDAIRSFECSDERSLTNFFAEFFVRISNGLNLLSIADGIVQLIVSFGEIGDCFRCWIKTFVEEHLDRRQNIALLLLETIDRRLGRDRTDLLTQTIVLLRKISNTFRLRRYAIGSE